MIKMKRLLITLALTISVVATTFALDSPGTGAVTCYIDPDAPYNVGSGVKAFSYFYCSSGSQRYQTCLWENNVNIRCNSGLYSGGTQWFPVSAICNYDGYPNPSYYKTTAYIYTTNWVLIKSATTGTTYYNSVYDC